MKSEALFIQGNSAVVRGALDAGLDFFAGYPITPSSEIAEELSVQLPKRGGTFIQMEDEIASLAAVIGASLGGAKAMTATSGPGFSLMQENIGFAAMTEVPCVIVNVMRGGPSTGLPTHPSQADLMQARWGTHGDRPAIALYGSSVAECYTLTVTAFNLSERYRLPVILLLDEIVAHMREKVELAHIGAIPVFERRKPVGPPSGYKPFRGEPDGVPLMAAFGEGYRYHVTGLTHDEMGMPTSDPLETSRLIDRLMGKVAKNTEEIVMAESILCEDASTVIVACGSVARSAREAVRILREKKVRAGLFRPITIWPFPGRQLAKLLPGASTFIVPEMNAGQLVFAVEHAVGCRGRVISVTKTSSELFYPEEIVAAAL